VPAPVDERQAGSQELGDLLLEELAFVSKVPPLQCCHLLSQVPPAPRERLAFRPSPPMERRGRRGRRERRYPYIFDD
jgi:hypothetical protein